MKKLLLTGGTGFIGRNILPVLREKYDVAAPTRAELDVYRADSVDAFLAENPVDFLVHCAICTRQSVGRRKRRFGKRVKIFSEFQKAQI